MPELDEFRKLAEEVYKILTVYDDDISDKFKESDIEDIANALRTIAEKYEEIGYEDGFKEGNDPRY